MAKVRVYKTGLVLRRVLVERYFRLIESEIFYIQKKLHEQYIQVMLTLDQIICIESLCKRKVWLVVRIIMIVRVIIIKPNGSFKKKRKRKRNKNQTIKLLAELTILISTQPPSSLFSSPLYIILYIYFYLYKNYSNFFSFS